MKSESLNNKIAEKDKIEKRYLEKLELIKQAYGINFTIESFNDKTINKIKFYNLKEHDSKKNMYTIYDRVTNNFNYISFDNDEDIDIKDITNNNFINSVIKENKLNLAMNEILKVNNDYILELKNIAKNYEKITDKTSENTKELEISKKSKK